MRNKFSTFDLVKALDIKRVTLQDWMNRGFVNPTIPAKGKGVAAIFNRPSVYAVAFFKIMLEWGISRSEAADILPKMLFQGDFDKKGILLLKIGKGKADVVFLTPDYRIIDDAKEFRKFVSIDMYEFKQDVDGLLSILGEGWE